MPPNVFRELIDGRVATLRIRVHRLEHDGVQIPPQPAAQPFHASLANGADLFRSFGVAREISLRPVRSCDRRAGSLRPGLAEHAGDLGERPARETIGRPAAQQLVEHDTQRIDVARRRRPQPLDLLGTRVLGRHQVLHRGRARLRPRVRVVQDRRDSEVEKLGGPVAGDEYVRRFDVAMNHEMLMGEGDRRAHLPKQLEPLRDVQSPVVAVAVDRDALDELHHEIRRTVVRRAAVVESRDVRVIEAGEDPALGLESAQDPLGVQPLMDQLDGHLLLELPIDALAEADDAHPAATDLLEDSPRADLPTFETLLARVRHRHERLIDRLLDEAARTRVCVEETRDFEAQLGVFGTRLVEVRSAFG